MRCPPFLGLHRTGGAAPVEHSLVLALQLMATHAATPPLKNNNNNNYNQAGFSFPAEWLNRCRCTHSSPAPRSRAGWGACNRGGWLWVPSPWGEAEQQLVGSGVPVHKGNLHLLGVPPAEENRIHQALSKQSFVLGGEGRWPCAADTGNIHCHM